MRTCVGCRQVVPQDQLLRLAVTDERVVADPRRRTPGRGVYVHARPDCLRGAGKGGLARALKRGVSRAELDAIAAVASATAAASQGGEDAVERAPHLTSTSLPLAAPGQADPSDRSSHGAHGA
ncbi:MAG: YlxR family protein [Myxococcales bacterium]|nr:YlxR family protein [Myxococcales bacterium]